MKKLIFGILLITLICNVASCKKDVRKEDVKKIISEWTDRTIVFPDDIKYTLIGKDSIYLNEKAPYSIFLYTDSTGCTDCKLEMYKWEMFIKEIEKEMPGEVNFLFYFHPKDVKELIFILSRDNFNYPVFIDKENKINALNDLPPNNAYQCFLLNENNKVICIGNPITNTQIWELYKKILRQEKENNKL